MISKCRQFTFRHLSPQDFKKERRDEKPQNRAGRYFSDRVDLGAQAALRHEKRQKESRRNHKNVWLGKKHRCPKREGDRRVPAHHPALQRRAPMKIHLCPDDERYDDKERKKRDMPALIADMKYRKLKRP